MAEEVKTVDTSVNEAETTVENQNTQEVVTTTAPEPIQETKEVNAKVEEKEKVFTQAQLDEILVTRLGKERARMLKKLGVDDESGLDSILQKSSEYEKLKEEFDVLQYERQVQKENEQLLKLGADKDFADYIRMNVVPNEGQTFEEAAKEFLESNPKFKVETFKNVNSSVNVNSGSSYPDFNQMTTEQYLAWRAKNKL